MTNSAAAASEAERATRSWENTRTPSIWWKTG